MPTTNVVDLRLDVFRFVAKKQASQKGSLFRLKFAMHILLAKPSNFIVKELCQIYRQSECHFNLCYCYHLNIADVFLTDQFQLE